MLWRKHASKPAQSLLIIVSLALLVFAPVVNLFGDFVQPAAADASTLTQSTDINTVTRAIKYYYMMKYCAYLGAFSDNIAGDQISTGTSKWMNNTPVQIGTIFDNWGDKNGRTYCYGETNDQGWFSDALQVFGIDTGNKIGALQALGYNCPSTPEQDGKIHCRNSSVNDPESNSNSLMGKIKALPYFKGADISINHVTYAAASYNAALTGFTSICKAQQGGYQNLVDVKTVDTNGNLTTSKWTYTDSSGVYHSGALDLTGGDVDSYVTLDQATDTFHTVDTTSISTSCSGLIDIINKNASSFQLWSGESVCLNTYGLALDTSGSVACAYGWMHQKDASYCLSNQNSNPTVEKACFNGQGLPVDGNGVTSGELCLNQFSGNLSQETACINGSLNKKNPNYCNATYPAPDNLSASTGKLPTDTNKVAREACQTGATLQVGDVRVATVAQPGSVTKKPADTSTTSCAVDGIGWIVCPVLVGLSKISDGMFGFLAGQFLNTNVAIVQTDSPTFTAWSTVRNLANIAFVIVFMIIIFSQVTGYGVTNYGVKKMLPRLIMAAILVNLSFYIAQLAVDLSNILGYGIKSLLDSVSGNINSQSGYYETGINGNASFFSGLTSNILAGAAIAGGAALIWFNLAALVPVLVAGMVAVLMIFLMLILREMLIVLMVVLSPLAFVAFILPNTSSLFTKWRKTFTALLLVFPIVSLIYGGSMLASIILRSAYQGAGGALQQVVAAAIMTLPLFIVPVFLKKSLDGVNGIGNLMNKVGKGFGGMAGKGASKVYGNSALERGRQARAGARQNYRNRKFADAVSGQNSGRWASLRRKAAMGGPAITGAQQYAKSALDLSATSAATEADAKDVKAAEQQFASQNLSPEKLREQFTEAVAAKDSVRARAAQNMLLKTAPGREEFHNAIEGNAEKGIAATNLGAMESILRTNVNSNHPDMKGKDASIARWGYDSGATLSGHQTSPGTYSGLSDADMAGQRLENMRQAHQHGTLNSDMAKRILSNPSLSQGLSNEQREFLSTIQEQASAATTQSTGISGGETLEVDHSDTGDVYDQRNAEAASRSTSQQTPPMSPEWQEWHKQEAERQARQAATPSTAGSHVDEQGRQTPNTAPGDYHDRMQQ